MKGLKLEEEAAPNLDKSPSGPNLETKKSPNSEIAGNVPESGPRRNSTGTVPTTIAHNIRNSVLMDRGNLPNLEGYLEKKGAVGMIKRWKRRYMRLVEDKLCYYRDKEHRDAEKLLGFIDLSTATAVKFIPHVQVS